jgi:hypothetical protein
VDDDEVLEVPSDDEEDNEVRLDAGKMMASSTCSILSPRNCRA